MIGNYNISIHGLVLCYGKKEIRKEKRFTKTPHAFALPSKVTNARKRKKKKMVFAHLLLQ